MLILWAIVFIASLAALVKGADWLLASGERIGLAFGLSPFVVGIIIIGVGTSCPELGAGLAAVLKGVTHVVVPNAIGSNIVNILLVVGFSAVIGQRIAVTKNLIDLDLPLLAIGTALLLCIVWDRQITFGESLLLLATYGVYVLYTVLHKDTEDTEKIIELLLPRRKLAAKDIILLAVGILGVVFGANYLIESLVKLSEILNVATGVIALTAVAFGTSLPELVVFMKAVSQNKSDLALGNILGSNMFNALFVTGLPGLFGTLLVDNQTFTIGVPIMALATLLFIISGISKRIHRWEGAGYLSLYVFCIAKLFNWL